MARLNGRAAIMDYMGITLRTYYRWKRLGMPVYNGPHTRAWAKSDELDAWSSGYVPGNLLHRVPEVARRRVARRKAG